MSDPRARFHRVAPLILLRLLFIGVCLAGSEANAAVDDKADREQINGYYAATFGRSGSDIVFVHYWSSGDMLRSETVLHGNPIVTIVREKTYYCYNPLTRQGYAIKRSKRTIAIAEKLPRPFANELHQMLENGGEKVRSDPLGGTTVDVYRVTDDAGKRTLWVTTDGRDLPLRLESYSRRSGNTTRLDWANWMPGIKVPDDYFDVPRDIELRRFDSYEVYIEALGKEAIPPAPPLFHNLLHQPED
jgi:outer membrane lipoprotein-sorting protein